MSHLKQRYFELLQLPRWRLYGNHTFVETPTQRNIEASIDMDWNTHMQVDPALEKTVQLILEQDGIEHLHNDPTYDTMFAVHLHEERHWLTCPFDKEYFTEIISGISKSLNEKGLSLDGEIEERNTFVSNLRFISNHFEDLIVNTYNGVLDTDKDQFNRGHDLSQRLHNQESMQQNGHIGPLNTFLTELQTLVWQTQPELRRSIQTYFDPDPKIREDACNLMGNLLDNQSLASYLQTNPHLDEKRIEAARFLTRRKPYHWHNLAQIYTDHIFDYLEKDEERQQDPGSQFIQVLFGPLQSSGEGNRDGNPKSGGNQDQDAEENSSQSNENGDLPQEGKPLPSENQGDNEQASPGSRSDHLESLPGAKDETLGEVQGKIPDLYDAMNKTLQETLIGIGIEKGIPIDYAAYYDQLNALYNKRSERIIVDLIDPDSEEQRLRIADLNRERSFPDNFNIRRIQWSQSRIIGSKEGKKLFLYQGDVSVDEDDTGDPALGAIPDIAFIFDSSGSMNADLLGGRGPYDLLLRAQFSLLNWIEKTGKAYHMQFAGINFSGRTLSTGWVPYKDLKTIKKSLFNFQDGGTVLDPNSVRDLYQTRNDPFLAILTTDGAVSNVNQASQSLQELVMAGNALAYLKIGGGHDGMTQSLESIADIHLVQDPKDLVDIHLSYGEQYWGPLELKR